MTYIYIILYQWFICCKCFINCISDNIQNIHHTYTFIYTYLINGILFLYFEKIIHIYIHSIWLMYLYLHTFDMMYTNNKFNIWYRYDLYIYIRIHGIYLVSITSITYTWVQHVYNMYIYIYNIYIYISMSLYHVFDLSL